MVSEKMQRMLAEVEKLHTEMYEAAPHNIKDLRDDAYLIISQGLDMAKAENDKELVKLLESHQERIGKSYTQLRI